MVRPWIREKRERFLRHDRNESEVRAHVELGMYIYLIYLRMYISRRRSLYLYLTFLRLSLSILWTVCNTRFAEGTCGRCVDRARSAHARARRACLSCSNMYSSVRYKIDHWRNALIDRTTAFQSLKRFNPFFSCLFLFFLFSLLQIRIQYFFLTRVVFNDRYYAIFTPRLLDLFDVFLTCIRIISID